MNHAMRLLVIGQNLWAQYGFWAGVTILFGLLFQPNNSSPTFPEIFWYRVFLSINATLTTRMLYQCIASHSSEFAAVGAFIQLWSTRWIAHILGAFTLASAGKGIMDISNANVFSAPFEAFGMILIALAGIWFLLAALVMPVRFITAIAQQIQKHIDQRRRAS